MPTPNFPASPSGDLTVAATRTASKPALRQQFTRQAPVTGSIRGLFQRDQPVYRQIARHGFRLAAGPGDFNFVDDRCLAKTKVQGHDALGQVAGFAVLPARERPAARLHANKRPDGVAVGHRADEPQLQPVDWAPGAQIAHEHLRTVVELSGDDVEVAVVVEIEDGSRARAQGSHDRVNAGVALAELVSLV